MKFAKTHLDKTFNHWKKVLWTDETKIEFFSHSERHYVWRKPKTVFEEDLLLTVKHGGGSIMVWGCFAASGTGKLAHIEGTMNSNNYRNILRDNVPPSVRDLRLWRGWILQQVKDPKHTSKSTQDWLTKKKLKALEWPGQSPDLNPIEMLWFDPKRALLARKPSKLKELQTFCDEEWAKIFPDRCQRLITDYRKRLVAVIAAK